MNVPILAVDDEPANLFALRAVLEEPGIEIVTAASGQEALRYLVNREVALIVLDVNMPDLDGFETAALIRARPASAHIPIIFITASGSDSERMIKAYEAGAADFVLKPYEPVVLQSKVSVFVALHRMAELKRRATQLETNNRLLEVNLEQNQRLAQQLAHQAAHDQLTGLPNRHLFEEILRETLAVSQRSGTRIAVAFIDLDHFKFINDSFGHAAGDEVLKEAARRLVQAIRASDMTARIGGDEFVVMLTEFVQWQESTRVAEKLLHAFSEPFKVGDCEVKVSPSVGIAIFPDDGNDCATLLKYADIAMYRAKQAGRNSIRFFTTEMSEAAAQQLALENSLRLGLASDAFFLQYKPRLDLASGSITCVEALLRWRHPQGGVMRASDLMTLAEHATVVAPIGEQVLAAVGQQAHEWLAGDLAVDIAINISARDLRGDRLLCAVDELQRTLQIDPAVIEFGVTAHSSIFESTDSIANLHRLRDLGCKIALDDFGTGHSGLALLRQFRFDCVKLDRSLVIELPTNLLDAAIVESVIGVARRVGLGIVAKGVTTTEQVNFLRQVGCPQIQGEWVSGPVSAERCVELLRERSIGQPIPHRNSAA